MILIRRRRRCRMARQDCTPNTRNSTNGSCSSKEQISATVALPLAPSGSSRTKEEDAGMFSRDTMWRAASKRKRANRVCQRAGSLRAGGRLACAPCACVRACLHSSANHFHKSFAREECCWGRWWDTSWRRANAYTIRMTAAHAATWFDK